MDQESIKRCIEECEARIEIGKSVIFIKGHMGDTVLHAGPVVTTP